MQLVVYVRGGLGDVWPAFSAIWPIMVKNKIKKQDVFVITDSVYYFRAHPPKLAEFSLRMCEKISPNIVMVPVELNDNFRLTVDDVTNELSQENADKNKREFMFWRPKELKDFVKMQLGPDTIFIDALFTECIMEWDFKNSIYKRVGNERCSCEFNPSFIERAWVDQLLKTYPKHVLVHVRKKNEGDAVTQTDEYYSKILTWCGNNGITPILIGADDIKLPKGISLINIKGTNALTFETMGYLISKCNVMLGNDSGFSSIKLYQQQKHELIIMDYPRWERSPWYFRSIGNPMEKSNYLLLNANEYNIDRITGAIDGWYEENPVEVKNESTN